MIFLNRKGFKSINETKFLILMSIWYVGGVTDKFVII